MNGTGSAWGAISFVNALPTGVGAAAAITLSVRADVELTPSPGGSESVTISRSADTPLVRTSLLNGLRALTPSTPVNVSLKLDSAIPFARGLKSSSAIPVAILRALASALARPVSPADAARFSAEVGQSVGLSATGAFDDAAAAAMGGFVVADTNERRLLRHDISDPDWCVVLWVPRSVHTPSPAWVSAFRKRAGVARGAVDAAKAGRYLTAMDRNTEVVEEVMGYPYGPLRRELRRQGALGSGVSGMGPTLASIVPVRSRSTVGRTLPIGDADVLHVEFAPPGSSPSTENDP